MSETRKKQHNSQRHLHSLKTIKKTDLQAYQSNMSI